MALIPISTYDTIEGRITNEKILTFVGKNFRVGTEEGLKDNNIHVRQVDLLGSRPVINSLIKETIIILD